MHFPIQQARQVAVFLLLLLGTGLSRSVYGQDNSDERKDFEASFFLGTAVDTFASGHVLKVLNPEVPTGPKLRGVGGFDFAYRLLGAPPAQSAPWKDHQQLWVYGETVHGARSTEINCQEHSNFPTCKAALIVPSRAPDQLLFILRNATSLEGFLGLRWEFAALQPRSEFAAQAYFKVQAGFLTVSHSAGDVADVHHLGLGAIIAKGDYEGSYLEVG